MMIQNIAMLFNQLRRVCEDHYAAWKVTHLEIFRTGLEAVVCKAYSEVFGPIAIKVPWSRWISNDNDTSLDGRDLLRQEKMLSTHLAAYGIAVPCVYALHEGKDDFDFLVSDFIEHDSSEPDEYEFGTLMRAIHESPLPTFPFVMQGNTSLSVILTERLTRRLEVAKRLSGVQLDIAPAADIQSFLEQYCSRRCVLHMDARPANILTQNRSVRAIVDWSNALQGDPALDLARIAEYGHLSHDFLAGYGVQDCFSHLPRAVELLYRLDTAVMLTVVFLSESEIQDLQRGQAQVQRVRDLCATLRAERL